MKVRDEINLHLQNPQAYTQTQHDAIWMKA